ncbi:MAG: S41 family peptidase [Planctomycetes bacterium]|jgi:carboxyl-terminal processing protease|nr:S41 family peptidase [Planctomycetota bacterium]
MEQQPRLPLWFLVVNWALIAAAFCLGLLLGGRRLAELPEPQRSALELVHREILRSHVDAHDAAGLLDQAIAGMVNTLDPYSRYVPPSEVKRYEEANSGHYEGIGAQFGTHDDAVVLWYPLADSPAEAAGLLPGDLLLAVDDRTLDGPRSRAEVTELVRGPADTTVRLRVRRDGGERVIPVRRGDVQKACVKWAHRIDAEAGLGYVHLSDFHPAAARQLLAALAELQRGGPLRGLILDLRFDGGGSLDECIAIARAFLPGGRIVTQRRRDQTVETHDAGIGTCAHPELPLVLLVNEHSASASEVLAGALQDHGRAAIIGTRTHGKACVNTVYTWKGLDLRLKLTTGRYLTPNGRDIERHHRQPPNGNGNGAAGADDGGIVPDVDVPVRPEQKALIASRLDADEPPAAFRERFVAVATRYGVTVPVPPSADGDPQLTQALTTLRERIAGATTPK